MPAAEFFAMFGLFARRDFLHPSLCADLRRQLRSADREEATVRAHGSTYVVDPEIRRAGLVLPEPPGFAAVESRLLEIQPELSTHFQMPLSGLQTPVFLVYRAGDFYVPHRDNTRAPGAAETPRARRVSAVVFLNSPSEQLQEDRFGGGALTFYDLMPGAPDRPIGFPLDGVEGLLVAFRSEITPRGLPGYLGRAFHRGLLVLLMLLISRSGFSFSGSADDLTRMAAAFRARQSLQISGLLDPPLLRLIQAELTRSEFHTRTHGGIGVETCMESNAVAGLLHFLVNNRDLFRFVESVSGCGPIGCFSGRVYRMVPGEDHYDSWHGGRATRARVGRRGDDHAHGARRPRDRARVRPAR